MLAIIYHHQLRDFPISVQLLVSYGCEIHTYMYDEARLALKSPEGRLMSLYGTTEAGPLTIFDGLILNKFPDYYNQYVRKYNIYHFLYYLPLEMKCNFT